MSELRLYALRFAIAGAALIAVGVALAIARPVAFFHGWLLGFMLILSASLGCLAVLLIHHLTDGRWGFCIRRTLEAGIGMPLLVALFAFLVLFFAGFWIAGSDLYPWLDPNAIQAELPTFKRTWLSVPFFTARATGYFAMWFGMAWLFRRWSRKQDERGGESARVVQRKLQLSSGPGLIIYGLTVTFAAVDWVMSLESSWVSTIYGMIYMTGDGLAALAVSIVLIIWLRRYPPIQNALGDQELHDLGNLLLAFVMLWAYVSFSQYLITWSGNLPEEIPWYLHRSRGGWQWIAGSLIVVHFAVPFLVLLSRQTKQSPRALALVAGGLLVLRYVEHFWLIMPAWHEGQLSVHLADVVVPLSLIFLWTGAVLFELSRRPLLPVHAPEASSAETQMEVAP